jgi:nucleoside-diphosphate-sugar epimerase
MTKVMITGAAGNLGRLDGNPISVHARTRLEEEKYLFNEIEKPVSLRVGMVYGKGKHRKVNNFLNKIRPHQSDRLLIENMGDLS